MINTKEFYTDLGWKAARAMNRKDVAAYQYFSSQFNRGKALEKDEDKDVAVACYNEAFAMERTVPKQENFQ